MVSSLGMDSSKCPELVSQPQVSPLIHQSAIHTSARRILLMCKSDHVVAHFWMLHGLHVTFRPTSKQFYLAHRAFDNLAQPDSKPYAFRLWESCRTCHASLFYPSRLLPTTLLQDQV